MAALTRREYLQGLLGATASLCLPQKAVSGQGAPIPAQGVGRRIRHLSYSDIGGRPDSVQVMVNRRHLYVGHMFSNGVTILDAADPRQLKPVGLLHRRRLHPHASPAGCRRSAAARQRREHRGDAVLRQHARLFRERAGRQHHQPQEISFGPEHSRYFPSRGDEGDCLSRNAGLRHQSPVVAGRTLRLRRGAFRWFHRSHSLHRRPEEHHEARDCVALVAARHESGGRRDSRRCPRAGGSPCIT